MTIISLHYKQFTLPKLIYCLFFIGLSLSLQLPIAAMQSDFDDGDKGVVKHTSKRLRKTPLDEVDDKLKEAKVPTEEKQEQYVQEEEVELVRGKLPRNENKLPDNYFWKIYFQSKSAGKVFIDLTDIPPLGRHPAIQIFLNKKAQGRHIGRIAYRKACQLSHYDIVYATMRRSNIASFKAATAAGFRELKNRDFKQCVMKWVR